MAKTKGHYRVSDIETLAGWVRSQRPPGASAPHLAVCVGVEVVDTGPGTPAYGATHGSMRFRRHRRASVTARRQWLALAMCLLIRAGCPDATMADAERLAEALARKVT